MTIAPPFFEILEEPKPKPLFNGRVMHKFRTTEDAKGFCCTDQHTEGEYCPHDRDIATTPAEADVVSSLVNGSSIEHMPVIDFDLPIKAVESGTAGHYHLYIDKVISWSAYLKILKALAEADLVQPGYVAASEARGYSSVRVPWKPKGVEA